MRPWLVIPGLPRISSRQMPVILSISSDEGSTQVSAHVAEGATHEGWAQQLAPSRPARWVGESPSYR